MNTNEKNHENNFILPIIKSKNINSVKDYKKIK